MFSVHFSPTQTLVTADLFTASIVLPLPEHHIVRIIRYIAFLDWQLSVTNKCLNFTHVFLCPDSSFHFLKKVLFLVALGPCCFLQAFSSCGELWLLLVAVCVASQCRGFSCWRARALEHVGSVVLDSRLSCSVACGILLAQESNPRSPALAGEFLTIRPPEVPGQIFNWKDSRITVNAKQTYFRFFIARHRKLTRDTEWHLADWLAQCWYSIKKCWIEPRMTE